MRVQNSSAENNDSLLNRNFVLLTACFICAVSVSAMFFMFSGYLASLNIDSGRIGVIVSADALSALVVQFLVSPFINSANVKRWLVSGLAVFIPGLVLVGITVSFYPLILGRLLQGAGFVMILSSLMTLIVNYIPPKKSGTAFGFLSLIRLVPYSVIPVIYEMQGIKPASFAESFTPIYLLAVFPAAALFIKISNGAGGNKPAAGFGAVKNIISDRRTVFTLVSSFFLFAGYSAVFFYIKPYGEHIGLKDAGLFLSVETAGMFFTRLFFAGFFDRYDKVKMATAGIVVSMAAYILIPAAGTSVLFYALALLCGVGWGVAMPVQNAFLFDISDKSRRAVTQNLMLSMMQAGFFAGTLTASPVIGYGGYTLFFVYISFLTLLAAAFQISASLRNGRQ